MFPSHPCMLRPMFLFLKLIRRSFDFPFHINGLALHTNHRINVTNKLSSQFIFPASKADFTTTTVSTLCFLTPFELTVNAVEGFSLTE